MKQSTETFKINLLDIIIFLNYLFFVLRHLTSRPGTHYVAQAVLEPTESASQVLESQACAFITGLGMFSLCVSLIPSS